MQNQSATHEYARLKGQSVFVESGAFADYGGWVLDTQFIVNMGSAYLLAHGLGQPVADAATTVRFPSKGEYKVWAFTRDWVAPWKTGVAPGLFRVLVDGGDCGATFGNEGAAWHWQCGGKVSVSRAEARVALHDLTGFEGRCAALFFTRDEDFVPPNDLEALTAFRRAMCGTEETVDCGAFDLLVAGGGIAGICAALSAAREGLTVALVQDRFVVGGNNSSEVRVWLGGETCFPPYSKVGSIVTELEQERKAHYGPTNTPDLYEDEKKLALLQKEKNITLLLGHTLVGAETDNGIIQSALLYEARTGAFKTAKAALFVDATGDGALGAAAGADFEVTTNGHMGMTNVWYIEDTGAPQTFPRCPWAIDLTHCDFPGRKGTKYASKMPRENTLGGWYWESGMEHDPIEKAEYARDTNFRAMYGAWDCLKNVDHDYETFRLGSSVYIGGKRESRRFMGDVLLTKSEVKAARAYDDACVPSTWSFDVHYPKREFYASYHEGDAFLTTAYYEHFPKPYFVPYRCLYSRNVGNLFVAGRNVSVSHDALGTVRVMRTGGMMGEVVGKAAAICKARGVLPRGVYEKHLETLLDMCRGE